MTNSSQNDKKLNSKSENNEIKSDKLISSLYNKFYLLGMIDNELKKDVYHHQYVICNVVLKVPGNQIFNIKCFNKIADEVATIYKKGDWVAFEGVVKGVIDVDGKFKVWLTANYHKLVNKNLNIESIKDHEYHFKQTEQLYDPFKVQERMLEKGDNE